MCDPLGRSCCTDVASMLRLPLPRSKPSHRGPRGVDIASATDAPADAGIGAQAIEWKERCHRCQKLAPRRD